MSAQARQTPDQDNPAQDYIVEYRAGQFQNGSLVLRFDSHPSEQVLRNALKDFGLPPAAVQEVRARPLNTGRMWEHAASARDTLNSSRWSEPSTLGEMSPTKTQPEKKRRPGLIFLIIAMMLFGFIMFQSPDSQQRGEFAGIITPSSANQVTACFQAVEDAGIYNTGAQQFFQDSPTSFPFSPQNAAFLFACVSAG